MKFATFNNQRIEPAKGAKGQCPCCGAEMIAKCGEIKVHHWAHKGKLHCDPWWENETEWHRQWKNQFPKEWQEVVHTDRTGEKHIADVKTAESWVLEFQHSAIKPEERNSRNSFYSNIVWVIDGLRLDKDKSQFEDAYKSGQQIMFGKIPITRISKSTKSRLIRNWGSLNICVFFDFQGSRNMRERLLWLLLPRSSSEFFYFVPFSGNDFIELHNKNGFSELTNDIIPGINKFISKSEAPQNPTRLIIPRNRRRRF